ncbi:hypothetical protein LOK49_LG06G01965 [Camellia lanceoleosa]|uniref:Uncharacterized protein n=1 Tax=Camellia lanceoleosa TaxID=1840588 RepID=A0ACC0HCX3_9ERIC|nr:hypothetical protein LOK49_LG06G01965 [Camellia lanceoleosa]
MKSNFLVKNKTYKEMEFVSKDKVANSSKLESFAYQISYYKCSRKRVGGLKLEELPGLEALQHIHGIWSSSEIRIRFKNFTSLLQKKGQRLSKMMQLFMCLVQNGVVGYEGLDLCLKMLLEALLLGQPISLAWPTHFISFDFE